MKNVMLKISLTLAAAATAAAFVTPGRFAPAGEDRAAVERAVLDYVEGIYEVKPEYIERSVHPDLTKYGFWCAPDATEYKGMAMTRDELVALAGKWNADGSHANADSPKKVEVLGLLDQTAAVKLTAEWGIDYMHLAKFDGKWQISQVMWQSHPRAER